LTTEPPKSLGETVILIAYDGSDDAKAALEQAVKLFPGGSATILTVWQRLIDTMARVGAGVGVSLDYDEVDDAAETEAKKKAAEGAAIATAAGLNATSLTTVVETSVADAILAEAAALSAAVVVCGSRGYTGVKSLMLGSVSHHLLQHADRPVLVIPSPTVAEARAEHRESLK
jgi:nucleotide-binding universal stress UspA family protein